MIQKTKILIVDDRPENITALSELISHQDIQIYSALNGEEALAHVLEHEFALALLDVQMPGINGFELARLIRGVNRSKHLPVIFVTAEAQTRDILFEGYETGAVDLLFKPLDSHIVRTKVSAFVKMDQQSSLLRSQMEEVINLRQRAEDANIAKTQFLANMSHEIRTPLASVMGFADVLSQTELTEPERQDCLAAIRRNGEVLLRLIDDILDLARIETNQLKLVKAEFNLNELLHDLEASLLPRAEQKGVELKIASLPGNKRFLADPIRLKQILINLLGNALKFTEKGSVSLKTLVDQRGLVFSVEDTGIGMSIPETQKIFQPFSQADISDRRRFGGTGLGLVISRQLAQSMNGDLQLLDTEAGKGSIFEVYVQAEEKPMLSLVENTPPLKENLSIIPGGLEGRKVLVVDDVVDNRALVERYLKSSGAVVLQASGGLEAVQKTAQEKPDLILMDIQMPGMDGYQATREIRAAGYDKPILAWTAHAMKEDLRRCIDSGCDEVMTKPARRQELVPMITRMILEKKAL